VNVSDEPAPIKKMKSLQEKIGDIIQEVKAEMSAERSAFPVETTRHEVELSATLPANFSKRDGKRLLFFALH